MITINWLVLMVCIAGVVVASVYKTEIVIAAQNLTAKYPNLPPEVTILAEAAPSIVLSLANGLI